MKIRDHTADGSVQGFDVSAKSATHINGRAAEGGEKYLIITEAFIFSP